MKNFLIVVDMQNDFIDGSLGTAEARAILPAAVKRIESFDGEIFATLDTHGEDYLSTAEGKRLPVVHCVENTDGWRIHPAIAAALDKKGYTPVKKPTFGSVALAYLLNEAAGGRACEEDISIELIGLCTDICVASNALLLKAFFPSARIAVDAACCAGVTPRGHSAALETMQSCQIDVLG